MVDETSTEVLVIGGGVGGYPAAIRAGQLGMDVTIVEDGDLGGTCLNRGCIPSKALIKMTTMAHKCENAERQGIHADIEYDFETLMSWKDRTVNRLTKGIEQLFKGHDVRHVVGRAEFTSDSSAAVYDIDDDEQIESIDFDHAIVATGSVPTELPGFPYDHEKIIHSKDVLAKDEIPDSMIAIGGGYICLELADVYQKLGTDVTVIGRPPTALRGFADDLVEPMVQKGERDIGLDYNFGMEVREWVENDDGSMTVSAMPVDEEDEDAMESWTADEVFVAIGRDPITHTATIDEAGIETNDWGEIEVDEYLETNVDNIYAVGDVLGEPMLAHTATHQGIVAAENIAGHDVSADVQAMPAVCFTDPEIAITGVTADEAEEQDMDVMVGKFPFRASGRSLAEANKKGFVRLVADAETEELIGGEVVGPEASELVAEITLAIETDATLEDVATTVHTHPTLSEAVMEAAEDGLGHATHIISN